MPETFTEFVARKGIVFTKGSHADTCGHCVLEALAEFYSLSKTDDPDALDAVDTRPLNDAYWPSDELRTKHMVRVTEALLPWRDWGAAQRVAFAKALTENIIRRVLPISLRAAGLIDAAERCAVDGTEESVSAARAAARAARAARDAWSAAEEAAKAYAWSASSAAAEWKATWASEAAAEAAKAAAEAAKAAAKAAAEWKATWATETLVEACQCFIDATEAVS